MLTNCNACGQIIEVSALNTHLLKECVKKDGFKQCKRCKESIAIDAHDAHTKALTCPPWKPASQASRCPLCHKDIGAGERGWRQHLMTKKCLANERNTPYEQPLEGAKEGTAGEQTQGSTGNKPQSKLGGLGQLSGTNSKAKK